MRIGFYVIVFLLLSGYLPTLFPSLGYRRFHLPAIFAAAAIHTYVLIHYFMDRQIFKMSNSEIRQRVLPYFVTPKTTAVKPTTEVVEDPDNHIQPSTLSYPQPPHSQPGVGNLHL